MHREGGEATKTTPVGSGMRAHKSHAHNENETKNYFLYSLTRFCDTQKAFSNTGRILGAI